MQASPIEAFMTALASLFRDIFSAAGTAAEIEASKAAKKGEDVAAKAVSATTGVKVTAAQVVKAYRALPSLEKALAHLVRGTAHLHDYETIGLDVLTAAAVIDPALAPDIMVIAALAPVLVGVFEVHPPHGDPDPIHNAQTTRNFNPGDTAARL